MLITEQKPNIVHTIDLSRNEVSIDNIKNFTDIYLNEEESSFLEKSLKYNINLDDKPNIIEDTLLDLESSISYTIKEEKDKTRYNFIHELDKTELKIKNKLLKQKSSHEMKLIKSIAQKIYEKGAVITKADKSNTVVIMKEEDNSVSQLVRWRE